MSQNIFRPASFDFRRAFFLEQYQDLIEPKVVMYYSLGIGYYMMKYLTKKSCECGSKSFEWKLLATYVSPD